MLLCLVTYDIQNIMMSQKKADILIHATIFHLLKVQKLTKLSFGVKIQG